MSRLFLGSCSSGVSEELKKGLKEDFEYLLAVNYDALDNETNSKVNNILEGILTKLLPKILITSVNLNTQSGTGEVILHRLSQMVKQLGKQSSKSERSLPSKLNDFLFACKVIYAGVPHYKSLSNASSFVSSYNRLVSSKKDIPITKAQVSYVLNFLKKGGKPQEPWTMLSFNVVVFEHLFWMVK